MDTSQDRLVIVSARALDDLLELSARAVDHLPQGSPLALALSGSRAEILHTATVDPI